MRSQTVREHRREAHSSDSLYTRAIASVVFPLHERLKQHDTVAVRAFLEETQWWSAKRLRALQLARLKRLLRHAADHVPYYREAFADLGFVPDELRAIEDLARLPMLTKPAIRSNLSRLKSERAGTLTRFNTGGSSGEPLIFLLGNERVSHDVAAKWRATRWWGVDIGDPEIVVWGSPIELGAQDRLRGLRDRVLRTELLPAFEMSEANLDRFVDRIRDRRPRMLFGYPSALAHIARHARNKRISMDDLGICVAFVTAERLYDDQQRDIQAVFGCRVANGYGGRDAGFIAHECPDGGMHVTAEDVIVEIVDEGGRAAPPGEAGEIVITHLATRDFPFIRYRTGDIGSASASPCRCGRSLPTLQEIQGRTTDFVVAADGTLMHGLALIYVIRDMPGVAAFKIVQESRALTRVLVVPSDGFVSETITTIQRRVKERLGEKVDVTVDQVKDIPTERSGKFRYVVSHALAA
jgi:phenylacetate-CoA ligase